VVRLNPETKYRPEIDGLRAIAVLAIVLFQAGFPCVSGGFVVDEHHLSVYGAMLRAPLLEQVLDEDLK
jgi:peptidoglycan/LPS O-acetylase OafA/YrhL